jgi:hypothetical protein
MSVRLRVGFFVIELKMYLVLVGFEGQILESY